ncbi:MAG TPA: hypothetical protein VJM31_11865 [Vicinamibacterales bacterium]|nr:hypothetical protein [Vicinamibacterales bacterium]
MRAGFVFGISALGALLWNGPSALQPSSRFLPGDDVLLEAHNAYPYQARWTDRLDRALSTGTPLAIEQDLVWQPATAVSRARSIVSPGEPFTGEEPTLRDFFERIRPIATRALEGNFRDQWPIITLNLDFKDSHPEHFAEIWRLLGDYEPWLTTAMRVKDETTVEPFRVGPLLVLTGSDPAQKIAFHDSVPVGSTLRLFGAVDAPNQGATNYLRWANKSWSVVEPEGQRDAGNWTTADRERLQHLVDATHGAGLWIRFHTLNGHSPDEGVRRGWSSSYNFGSIEQARVRWRAAIDAGVDFIATDQYEDFAMMAR